MAALVNQCAFTSALSTRIDRLLGNADIDLSKRFDQSHRLLQLSARRSRSDRPRYSRCIDLANWFYLDQHFGVEYSLCHPAVIVVALFHYRDKGSLDRASIFFGYTAVKSHGSFPKPHQLLRLCQMISTSFASTSFHHSSKSGFEM